MKAKKIIVAALTAILLLAVLCAAGLAFVPSIIASISNADARECREYSEKLLSVLEDKMSSDEESTFWYNLIDEGNSSKLVSALDNEAGGSEFAQNYYIKFYAHSLKLLCRSHPQVLDVSMKFPDKPARTEHKYAKPESSIVTGINAYGPGIYFAGAPLDKNNREKTVFTDDDDTSALFSDITVTASYAGGGESVLSPDEYKIEIGTLDMSTPAHKTLTIKYGAPPWQTISTKFDIDILPNDRREPLIVESSSGSYELTYWDWMDYFADSLDAPGRQYMDFSPSIVRDNGKFYYFPDGFAVMKDSKYNSSVTGARDTKIHDKQAHYVELIMPIEAYTPKLGERPKEGTIMVNSSSDAIYVWQDRPSKEFKEGWVQIFGEIKKFGE